LQQEYRLPDDQFILDTEYFQKLNEQREQQVKQLRRDMQRDSHVNRLLYSRLYVCTHSLLFVGPYSGCVGRICEAYGTSATIGPFVLQVEDHWRIDLCLRLSHHEKGRKARSASKEARVGKQSEQVNEPYDSSKSLVFHNCISNAAR
jgi:hypothetical protein